MYICREQEQKINMNYSKSINSICKLNDIKNKSEVKQTVYVVRDSQNRIEARVYADNEINNSDRVRSAFTKEFNTLGIKFTDTRCSRIKNSK